MSPVLTESAGTGLAPPIRPSFWRVGWSTFLGYLFTVVVCLPLVLLLSGVGVQLIGSDEGTGRGIFYRYDLWSWLAEACVGLVATFITALMVGRQLRQQTGWEVPFPFTFATLLLTGYAPVLALTPFYWAAAPISLGVAAVILRWRAEPSGAEPLTALGGVPRRFRRGVAIALAIAGPLMFAYVLAYAALHPIRGGGVDFSAAAGPGEGPVYQYSPGTLRRYGLWLEKSGPFRVTDASIVRLEGSPALQLERVLSASLRVRPLERFDLGVSGAGATPITLELRQGRLCPGRLGRLDAVWVRYTVLGTRQEQRIPLAQPPAVRCP